jgi:hypothetical protein
MKSLFFILLTAASCFGQPYSVANPPLVPDARLTPGAVMQGVTVEQLCTKGYANVFHGGVRHVPPSEKKAVFIAYFGTVPAHPGDYEIDHLVSLEIGGNNSISNLWPQPYNVKTWNARTKDSLEDFMAAHVRQCLKTKGHTAATALLKEYQIAMMTSWTNAYVRYLGQPSN